MNEARIVSAREWRARAEAAEAEVAQLRRVVRQIRGGLGVIELGRLREHDAAMATDAARIGLAIARCDAALAARQEAT